MFTCDIDRLYTAYLFHGLGHSAEEFHEDAVEGIAMFDRCLAEAQDRIECFVNASVINSMPASTGGCAWRRVGVRGVGWGERWREGGGIFHPFCGKGTGVCHGSMFLLVIAPGTLFFATEN